MSKAASRTIILDPDVGEDGAWRAPEERFWEQMRYLFGTLMAVGGKVEIVADRVKIGEIPGENGRPEHLAETVGFVIGYRTIPVLNEQPMTVQAMDYALRQQAEADVAATPPLGTPERAAADEAATDEALQAVAAALADGPVEEPADEEEQECECVGDHVPPCPFALSPAGAE